ncbi:soluble lamin-associated protein of 75 kDa [Rhinophrynus dorsalis]
MAFPVDILQNCSHEELESLSEDYLSDLRCADPTNPDYFSLPDHREVQISLSTVGFVPLYGGDQTHRVLALFAPEDTLTAVALYLADQWWAVDDIVRTSNPSREGLQQVRSLGERVALYVLNRIIYRKQEMGRNEVPFLCHSRSDYAKILWRKGEAVGFYSVKPSGSTCAAYLTQNYLLPVLDTMFIRKKYHDKEFALQMLEDFVDSFTEETLGLRYPLSSSMYTASKQYLEKYPGDQELLWEVEGVGHWFQRTLIASKFQKEARRLSDTKSDSSPRCSEASTLRPPVEPEARNEHISETQKEVREPCFTADVQVEPETEKNLKSTSASTSEELDVTPVSTRTRSSHLKRPKIRKIRQEQEPAEKDNSIGCNESTMLESKEQIVENFKELIQQLADDKDETDMTKLHDEISTKPVVELLEENQATQRIPVECCVDKQNAEPVPVNGEIAKDEIPKHGTDMDEFALDDTANNETTTNDTSNGDNTKNDTAKDDSTKNITTQDDVAMDNSTMDNSTKDDSAKENSTKEDTAQDDDRAKDDMAQDDITTKETAKDDTAKKIFQSSEVDTQEIAREAVDIESNLEPGDTDEKSLTTLVSVNMDMEKSLDSFPDQVMSPDDLEMRSHENMTTETENTMIRQEDNFKDGIGPKSTGTCNPFSSGNFSDNGLPSYVEVEPMECSVSDDTVTLDAVSVEKTTVKITSDAQPVLRQGPLLVVELKDLALQQMSEGSKSQSGDQSEESAAETTQSEQKSAGKGGESSSEDVETEARVVERRGLRRKGRVYKGPVKKRGKLSV